MLTVGQQFHVASVSFTMGWCDNVDGGLAVRYCWEKRFKVVKAVLNELGQQCSGSGNSSRQAGATVSM